MVCAGPLAYCYFRTFLDILFQVLILAIVARVALSWLTLAFPLRPGNPFYPLAVIIQQVTEPILAPMRRFLMIGMIDLSPLVAIVLLNFIQSRLDIALDGVVRGF